MTDDHVILITGASSGIGEATARLACEQGFRVVLAARSADRLEALSADLGGAARALPVTCDVTDFDSVKDAVTATVERFGRIDVVLANAGLGAARGFQNETPEHWRGMVETNVLGVAYTIRATMDALRASRGHLLVTGSITGRRPLAGSVYSATKAAVRSLADSARQELRGTGVRVTLIEPGTVDTPFFDNPQADALQPSDVASALLHAVAQPPRVDISEIVVRSVEQRDL